MDILYRLRLAYEKCQSCYSIHCRRILTCYKSNVDVLDLELKFRGLLLLENLADNTCRRCALFLRAHTQYGDRRAQIMSAYDLFLGEYVGRVAEKLEVALAFIGELAPTSSGKPARHVSH